MSDEPTYREPHYEQPRWGPPPDGPSAVFVSDRIAEQTKVVHPLLARVRAVLDPGEELFGVFSVVKVTPVLQMMVVTSQRILCGLIDFPERFSWPVEIAIEDVETIEVSGMLLANLSFHLFSGHRVKVGNLEDEALETDLRRVFVAARKASTGSTRAPAQSPVAPDTDPPTGPTYELLPPP